MTPQNNEASGSHVTETLLRVPLHTPKFSGSDFDALFIDFIGSHSRML